MSRTITALFDTREDADAGRQRLIAANVDADCVQVHDNSSVQSSGSTGSGHQDTSIWGSIKNALLPEADRHAYEEGIRRGGFLLTADVDGDELAHAVAALEDANGIDIEDRTQSWKNEGWNDQPQSGGVMFAGSENAMDRSSTSSMYTPAQRDETYSTPKYRSYMSNQSVDDNREMQDSDAARSGGGSFADTAKSYGNEAVGNVKQGIGSLTGNEELERSGEQQEQRGENQRDKDSSSY